MDAIWNGEIEMVARDPRTGRFVKSSNRTHSAPKWLKVWNSPFMPLVVVLGTMAVVGLITVISL